MVESWKYCQHCEIVEPNKMLPNHGNQKIGFLTDCLCQKGRYFVPTVSINYTGQYTTTVSTMQANCAIEERLNLARRLIVIIKPVFKVSIFNFALRHCLIFLLEKHRSI